MLRQCKLVGLAAVELQGHCTWVPWACTGVAWEHCTVQWAWEVERTFGEPAWEPCSVEGARTFVEQAWEHTLAAWEHCTLVVGEHTSEAWEPEHTSGEGLLA